MAEAGRLGGDAAAYRRVMVSLAVTGLVAAGCAARQPQTAPEPPTDAPPETPVATAGDTPVAVPVDTPTGAPVEAAGEETTEASMEGLASWYGVQFHGRRAADGSRYNMYELTAAHRTLEFGTRVRVTNLDNDRSVVVTITDRGPFVQGRIIDVSFAAAQRLGMVGEGVTRVRLEVLGG